jgi:hypothetical protein
MSVERRGPAICNVSNIGEGKDEMIKASADSDEGGHLFQSDPGHHSNLMAAR